MKCLVTGGAGFIGQALCDHLINEGAEVVIFDNLSPQIHGENASFDRVDVTFFRGDVSRLSDVESVFESHEFDVVYHLASETGTGQSMYEIQRYVLVNDLGTANCSDDLEICKTAINSLYSK